MQIKTLYKFTRPDGGVTVSPIMPDCNYTTAARLIADAGKALTDGSVLVECIDADSAEGWTEIDAPEQEVPDES